ncbi:MAG: phospholipase D-like domain-containing protein [Verrucomicrobiota bacterium]
MICTRDRKNEGGAAFCFCLTAPSRVLRLTLDRLSDDWQARYGHPVLVVEIIPNSKHPFMNTRWSRKWWLVLWLQSWRRIPYHRPMPADCQAKYEWLRSGRDAFAAMLADIAAARDTVLLETYIYADQGVGVRVRDALVAARQRGVRVRVLVDAWGSSELKDEFWTPLRTAGAEVRYFNPLKLARLGFRDHRKVLVCDGRVGCVGGFNVAPEYDGDGVQQGWCDHGLRLTGPLVAELVSEFDAMFARAEMRHPLFARLRKTGVRKRVQYPDGQLLLSGPGRGRNPFVAALHADLRQAEEIRIVTAYFLPSWRVRHSLTRAAHRGAKVQLLLAGISDVPIVQLAARSLYHRLLRAGVEIYEYQPQVLHAKLLVCNQAAYVGSANLDPRSLHINYELMLRLTVPSAIADARQMFLDDLQHAKPVILDEFRHTRTLWTKLRERWAYFLVARLDPFITRRLLSTFGA